MRTFLDDEDRESFLQVLGELVLEGVLEIHAFCLMPNHYHLLLRTPVAGLARWMRQINGTYVRRFNLRHQRVGNLWQGRYKAILVQEGRSLRECSRYIHLNPNRAKLTRPAERYRWSSYRNYVGGPPVVPWVETGLVLSGFGGDRDVYRAYVESGKGQRQVSPFERAVAGLALGSEAFCKRVRDRLEGRRPGEDEPSIAAIRRLTRADPVVVEQAAAEVFGKERPARQRRLLLYVQQLHSRLRPAEIARRYGRTRAAVSLAFRDLSAEARQNPKLASGLSRLAEILESGPEPPGTAVGKEEDSDR